jgi:polyisoprenoid-binding protein YceI
MTSHAPSPARFLAKILGLLSLTAAVLASAGQLLRYEGRPGESKVRIDGTSTLHDWKVEGTLIGGFFEGDEAFFKDPKQAATLKPNVQVNILVRTLKSGTKPMDNVMYAAMNMKDYPRIEYRLAEMKLKSAPPEGKGPYLFDTHGTLAVAGVTRTNQMIVSMEALADAKLKFLGTNKVKMTDFGIKPPAPAMALGAIKTGDDVTITFEWITTQKAAGPAAKE